MIEQIREECGLHLTLVVNLVHDETGTRVSGKYDFGVNKVPTKEQINEAVAGVIKATVDATEKTGWRLTNMEDFGFASTSDMLWGSFGG